MIQTRAIVHAKVAHIPRAVAISGKMHLIALWKAHLSSSSLVESFSEIPALDVFSIISDFSASVALAMSLSLIPLMKNNVYGTIPTTNAAAMLYKSAFG